VDPRRLIARRIAAHGLARARFDTPDAVLSWYGAMQGQEYGPAKWGIAQRARRLTNSAMDAAFDAGHILRTHMLRATWHFVAPRDLSWIQKLTSPRVHAGNASMYQTLELTPKLLARAADRLARALEGGVFLTRQEVSESLAKARIEATGQRLAYIVMFAELEALICSGPKRGKQFTYALAAERAPRPDAFDGDAAVRELTVRYFRSHGPATVRDFMWWSSFRSADARRAIAMADLREERIDGLVLWSLRDEHAAPRATPPVRLLPIYDEYFVAYRDRAHITRPIEGYDIFANYLVIDGCLAGTWRARGATFAVKPHAPLDKARREQLEREAARLQRFYGS
jgi:hypothetical protein